MQRRPSTVVKSPQGPPLPPLPLRKFTSVQLTKFTDSSFWKNRKTTIDPPVHRLDIASSNIPPASLRLEEQMARNLILNGRGIISPEIKEPTLNPNIRYRRYPPYDLGYNPYNVPTKVCMRIPARPAGDQHEWFTDHPYQSYLHMENLPDNLFLLERGEDHLAQVDVPFLADERGNIVVNDRREQLRFFSFLPRYIPHKIAPYILEFWFRLDSRLEPCDILERMQPNSKGQLPQGNAISMKRQRLRALINARAAQPGRVDPCRNEVEDLATLTESQILCNTTMWVSGGSLWIPRLGTNPIGIKDFIKTELSQGFFLEKGPRFIPSPRLEFTILLRHRLQSEALTRGFGNNHDNWKQLAVEDQPTRWHDRGTRYEAAPKARSGQIAGNNSAPSPRKRKAIELDGKDIDEWLDVTRGRVFQGIPSGIQRPPRRNRRQDNTSHAGVHTPIDTILDFAEERVGFPPSMDTTLSSQEQGNARPARAVLQASQQNVEIPSLNIVMQLPEAKVDLQTPRATSMSSERSDEDENEEISTSQESTHQVSSRSSVADFLLPHERTMEFPAGYLERVELSEMGPEVKRNGNWVPRELAQKKYNTLPPPRITAPRNRAVQEFDFPQASRVVAVRGRKLNQGQVADDTATAGFQWPPSAVVRPKITIPLRRSEIPDGGEVFLLAAREAAKGSFDSSGDESDAQEENLILQVDGASEYATREYK